MIGNWRCDPYLPCRPPGLFVATTIEDFEKSRIAEFEQLPFLTCCLGKVLDLRNLFASDEPDTVVLQIYETPVGLAKVTRQHLRTSDLVPAGIRFED